MARAYEDNESLQRNPNLTGFNSAVQEMAMGYYKDIDRPVVFDRAKAWTTPANFTVLKTINGSPKIIFTVRDTLSILSSFILQYRNNTFLEEKMSRGFYSHNYLPLEDAKCDFLMDSQQHLQLTFFALKTALKEENKPFVHFIDYDNFVQNPVEVLKQMYIFLEEDYYEHDLTHITKLESDSGLIGKEPSTLHKVYPTIGNTSPKPEDVLSSYVLNKYKDYDFWKGQI
jgi:hypothetical protein